MKKIKKVNVTRRIKVVLEEGKDSLISYGGGLLIDEFIRKLGLPEMIDSAVKVKKRESGFKESEAVLGLAVSMITGSTCLDDLVVLREEEAFKEIWRHGDIPHPTTMGDFLRRFDLGHIRQLESVLTRAFRTVYANGERMQAITIDIDSTLDEVHGSKKEGAKWAYTGIRALHPIMGFIRETGDWLHSRLRSGNVHTSEGAVSFIRECYHKVKDLADTVYVCMDSGFYDKEIVAECERLGIGFSITGDQTAPVMRAVQALSENQWIKIEDRVWVSELAYQPIKWPKAYRFVVRREEIPSGGQMTLLDDTVYRYHIIVTNRNDPAKELVPFHLDRAIVENLIKETKYGLSLDRFPCQEFHANWAYLTIGMLAYSIVSWIKRLALPSMYKKKLLKALRYRFFNVAARVVRHSRKIALRFAQGVHRFNDIMFAYERIVSLSFH
ncbi:MAG: IS1380 family transposase [Nitrospiraceae bacterium]|nr:IS1380 family transposase [Nitrospiraceae bacterium]